jgi:hypothetical protein
MRAATGVTELELAETTTGADAAGNRRWPERRRRFLPISRA